MSARPATSRRGSPTTRAASATAAAARADDRRDAPPWSSSRTATETEALLLEANLIKQLRPRFNVLLRDDKSFPYILVTADHDAPQIAKHRGARAPQGRLFRPLRQRLGGQPHHQRAAARLPAALLLGQLLREPHAALPAVPDQALRRPLHRRDLARRLRGARRRGARVPLRQEHGGEAAASPPRWRPRPASLEFERAARYRDRLAGALGRPGEPGHQPAIGRGGRRLRHRRAGRAVLRRRCSSSAPARTGATAPISPRPTSRSRPARCSPPSWRSSTTTSRTPRLVLLSHAFEDQALLEEALSVKAGRQDRASGARSAARSAISSPTRPSNAREALGRQLAERATQQKLLASLGQAFGLAEAAAPHRGLRQLAHHGHERGRRHDRRRRGRLHEEALPHLQHQLGGAHPGRRLRHDARGADAALRAPRSRRRRATAAETTRRRTSFPPGPTSSSSTAAAASSTPRARRSRSSASPTCALVGIAKGRGARRRARELLHGRARRPSCCRSAIRRSTSCSACATRRTASPSARHRAGASASSSRTRSTRSPGIGPARKRALLLHFGTAKAVARASLADLMRAPGVNAATAKAVYDFFHEKAG